MTTSNNKIVGIIGEINRTALFFKNNSNKKYGLDAIKKLLNIKEGKIHCILRFLLLHNIIKKNHSCKGLKEYSYNKENNKVLKERLLCSVLTLEILTELHECKTRELNEYITISISSIVKDIEKLEKQIKN